MVVFSRCRGCPANTGLFNDVSFRRQLEHNLDDIFGEGGYSFTKVRPTSTISNQIHDQYAKPLSSSLKTQSVRNLVDTEENFDVSCLCPFDTDITVVTETEFTTALDLAVQIIRNETNFTLVETVMDTIEVVGGPIDCEPADELPEPFIRYAIVDFFGVPSEINNEFAFDTLGAQFAQTYNEVTMCPLLPPFDTTLRQVNSACYLPELVEGSLQDYSESTEFPISREFSLLIAAEVAATGSMENDPSVLFLPGISGGSERTRSLKWFGNQETLRMSPRQLQEEILPICVCDAPEEQQFVESYNNDLDDLDTKKYGSLFNALDVLRVTEVVPREECLASASESTNFSSNITLDVMGFPEDMASEQLHTIERAVVGTYNQLNQLNTDVCDLVSRVALDADVTAIIVPNDDDTPETDAGRRRHLQRRPQRYFIQVVVFSRCRGCPPNTGLFNDVSFRRQLEHNLDDIFGGEGGYSMTKVRPTSTNFNQIQDQNMNESSKLSQNTQSHRNLVAGVEKENFDISCLCPFDTDITVVTEVEFTTALDLAVQIIRNETNFTLVETVMDTIEVISDDSDCEPVDELPEPFLRYAIVDFFGVPSELDDFFALEVLGDEFTQTYNEVTMCPSFSPFENTVRQVESSCYLPYLIEGSLQDYTKFTNFPVAREFSVLLATEVTATGSMELDPSVLFLPGYYEGFERTRNLKSLFDTNEDTIDMSHRLLQEEILPICICDAPEEQLFVDTYNFNIDDLDTIDTKKYGSLLNTIDVLKVTEVVPREDCLAFGTDTINFFSNITLDVFGDPEAMTSDQLRTIESVVVGTYNNLNQLNTEVCDLVSRTALGADVTAIVVPDDDTDEGQRYLQRRPQRYFIQLVVFSRCRGCPPNTGLFNDVSFRRQLEDDLADTIGNDSRKSIINVKPGSTKIEVNRESKMNLSTENIEQHRNLVAGVEKDFDTSCLCPFDTDITVVTETEFTTALDGAIQIIRNETNFTLVEMVMDTIENSSGPLDCQPVDELPEPFIRYAIVDFFGVPSAIDNDVALLRLGSSFTQTYNDVTMCPSFPPFENTVRQVSDTCYLPDLIEGSLQNYAETTNVGIAREFSVLLATEVTATGSMENDPSVLFLPSFNERMRNLESFDKEGVPGMSSRQLEEDILPICVCDAPEEQAFVDSYNANIDFQENLDFLKFGFSLEALDVLRVTEVVPREDCLAFGTEITNFAANLTLDVTGFPLDMESEQLRTLERAVVGTYNQLNQLNTEVCDLVSRIALAADVTDIIVPSSGSSSGSDSSRRQLQRRPQRYFIQLIVFSRCRGCPPNTGLFNDVSFRRQLEHNLAGAVGDHSTIPRIRISSEYPVTHIEPGSALDTKMRNLIQEQQDIVDSSTQTTLSHRKLVVDDTKDLDISCLCSFDTDITVVTEFEFATALDGAIQIIRNETNFTLVDTVIDVDEGDVILNECCGFSTTSFIPVDVDGPEFAAAVFEYIMDPTSSPYGTPINCWDTSRVTNMSYAFAFKIEDEIAFDEPLNCWDTSNVVSMSGMFCGAFEFNQELGEWNTSRVESMDRMFQDAFNFNAETIGMWDVSNVRNMSYMFDNAARFVGNGLEDWSTSNVQEMVATFRYALAFTGDIIGWDVSSVFSMEMMFQDAATFNTNLGLWDVQNVVSARNMFFFAQIFNQDLSDWSIDSLIDAENMFRHSSINQDLCAWLEHDGNLESTSLMFGATPCPDASNPVPGFGPYCFDCNVELPCCGVADGGGIPVDVNGPGLANAIQNYMIQPSESPYGSVINCWDTSGVTDMSFAFSTLLVGEATVGARRSLDEGSQYSLFNEPLNCWNTSRVLSMTGMFHRTSEFNQPLGMWDTRQVITMDSMFEEALSFNQSSIGNWNVGNVVDMSSMFLFASSFEGSGLENWNTSSVVDMTAMFQQASNFNGTIGSWNVTSVVSMEAMFADSFVFDQPLGAWNVRNVRSMRNMFLTAFDFNQDLSGWEIFSLEDATLMFGNTAFNQDLCSWTLSDFALESAFDMFANSACPNQGDPIQGQGPYCFTCIEETPAPTADICCGFPDGGGVPVDVNGLDFANAIRDYMFEPSESPYGSVINCWDTSRVTDMSSALLITSTFNEPIDCWNTSSVVSMTFMFSFATEFNQPLGSWDVSRVETMNGMFQNAISFNQSSIGNWNVGNVRDMSGMFSFASNFEGKGLENWNVSSVTDMSSMFEGCSSFNQDLNNWNVNRVQTMIGMFFNAFNFNQDLSGWEIFSLVNARSMFVNTAFNQDLCSWTLTDFSLETTFGMFANSACPNQGDPIQGQGPYCFTCIEETPAPTADICCGFPDGGGVPVDVNGLDLAAAIRDYMFEPSGSPYGPVINCWDTSRVTDMSFAFNGRGFGRRKLLQGTSTFNEPIDCWNTSSVVSMTLMFSFATEFNQPLGSWDVSRVETMNGMFQDAISFNQSSIGNWDVGNVRDMTSMFFFASSFEGKGLENWNTSKVESMSEMFGAAGNFNAPIGNWNVSSVTEMSSMFAECSSFNQDLNSWNVNRVQSTVSMFFNAISFNQDLSGWEITSLVDSRSMFENTFFNQDLCSWTLSDFSLDATFDMFRSSGCPNSDDPIPGQGPYCYTCIETNPPTISPAPSSLAAPSSLTTEVPCCGSVEGGGIPVDVDGPEFSNAIRNYMLESTESPYGSIINCWDTSAVTDMSFAFADPNQAVPFTFFNEPLNCWDTSNVISMSSMFQGAGVFNQELNDWDVSRVETFDRMFENTAEFNPSTLDGWNVGNARNMSLMFTFATSFQGTGMEEWVTSNVVEMSSMFDGANAFNTFIGSWDVSSVTDMQFMFSGANSFNQPLRSWNVRNVQTMRFMFFFASEFNQDLSDWDISSLEDASDMFGFSGLNQDLCAWVEHDGLLEGTNRMFADTECDNTNDPVPGLGPYCRECAF